MVSKVWNPLEAAVYEPILLVGRYDTLSDQPRYEFHCQVLFQVNTFLVGFVEVVDEVVEHASQEHIVVVIEHTNIILNYSCVWNWILVDM